MSNFEVVKVIEAIEMRDIIRFPYHLDIKNKLLLLQQKHSKYMNAERLNFPCFLKKLGVCIPAFCMFHLHASLWNAMLKDGTANKMSNQAYRLSWVA